MFNCVFMCLYVCVYACVICVWVCVCVCARARARTHMCACFDCVCDSYIFLHIYMYLYVHIRIQLYRSRCVCVCVCVCVLAITHTHLYIHKVVYDDLQRTHALKHTRIYKRIGKCISRFPYFSIKWWTESFVFPKRENYLTISTCVCMCARESEQQKKTDREGAPISCFFYMDTR